jgi:ABC-type sugar transport system substrate-binding protein
MPMKNHISSMFIILPLTLLIAFLSGCATTQVNTARIYEELPPKPVNEATSIAILLEKPTRPYRVIADFELSNPSNKTIQKAAAKLGAEAVYVLKYPRTTAGSTVVLRDSAKDKGVDVVAVCSAIVYK